MNYLRYSLLSITLLLFANGFAQKGQLFPEVNGESLTNKIVTLPEDVQGRYTIVGMAWSKKAEEDLESWLVPVYDLFIDKNTFIPIDYDVYLYFIPMFSGVKKGAYKSIMEKSKKQLDKKLAPHVLFYKGSIKDYREKLSLDDRTVPYFFVLDKTGKIVYTTSGKFTDSKLDKMEAFISE